MTSDAEAVGGGDYLLIHTVQEDKTRMVAPSPHRVFDVMERLDSSLWVDLALVAETSSCTVIVPNRNS